MAKENKPYSDPRWRGTLEELKIGLESGRKSNPKHEPTPEEIKNREEFRTKIKKMMEEEKKK